LSAYLEGRQPHLDLPIDVRATAFQRQVWAALRAIPYGATQSYQQVARAIERPKAVRAVAGACARNPVALVVPCHRVVRSDGDLGGYRWGIDRKRALLQQEALHVSEAASMEGGAG
jgi:O-6-methylguanine DNA methyltransferase